MSTSDHWQTVYSQKAPPSMSWFQALPTRSLALIEQFSPPRSSTHVHHWAHRPTR